MPQYFPVNGVPMQEHCSFTYVVPCWHAESLSKVKENFYLKYQDSIIPTLKLGNSVTLGQPLQARGYSLGTEYLHCTKGIFSGLKHANEQVYIAHTFTINPENSGGPLVSDANKVMGINTMKMQNAEEVNMSIPANRIKRVLPELLDNLIFGY